MRGLSKAYKRFYNTGKLSRKFKKFFLGRKLSKKQIKEKILAFEVVHQQKHVYEPTITNQPFFCPWCGCEATRSTGNMVEYPELWDRVYCLRCGKLVSEADNSTYHHVIEHIIEDEKRLLSLRELWLGGASWIV